MNPASPSFDGVRSVASSKKRNRLTVHNVNDHQGLLPSYALVTESRVHESRVAHTLRFEETASWSALLSF
jgi:hypothetical protein